MNCQCYACPNKSITSYNYDVMVIGEEEPLFQVTVNFCKDHDIGNGSVVYI